MCEFQSERTHKARTEKKCCSCGTKISKGESYTRYSGMYEGDFYSVRHCDVCARGYKAYAAYLMDRTRKDWKYPCSDSWMSYNEFESELTEWLDWFDTKDIEEDKNLSELVKIMPSATKWFETRKEKERDEALS